MQKAYVDRYSDFYMLGDYSCYAEYNEIDNTISVQAYGKGYGLDYYTTSLSHLKSSNIKTTTARFLTSATIVSDRISTQSSTAITDVNAYNSYETVVDRIGKSPINPTLEVTIVALA